MRLRLTEPLLFLWPWAVGFLLLTLGPLLFCFGMSFTNWRGAGAGGAGRFVGLDNYRRAIGVERVKAGVEESDGRLPTSVVSTDPLARKSLYNSMYYAAFATPLNLILSLIAALFLNHRSPGMSVLRGIVYLPHVLGGVATVMIWSWLLNPRFGSVNGAIASVGDLIDPIVRPLLGVRSKEWNGPAWLYSPDWCKPSVILMHAWTMGGVMLVFLAALRRVPVHLVEAARLDGAGSWARFRTVIWPHITPVVLFNAVFSFVFAMQAFNESYLLEHRSQQDGLRFFVRHLFDVAFEAPYRWGYASALAWILFGVTAMALAPLILGSRGWVHESLAE